MSSLNTKTFEYNLEGLRGLAAIIVVASHVISSNYTIDPGYHPRGIWTYAPPAHLGVLIFFIISGYVIGITSSKMNSHTGIFLYVKKRFLRLYPIYLISIILTLIITPDNTCKNIIGELLFVQVLLTEVLKGNPSLWSLNYEVIYYFLYIPIAYYKLNIRYILVITTAVAVSKLFLPFVPTLLSGYATGFIYWLVGVYIAQSLPKNNFSISNGKLISYILLLFSIDTLNPIKSFLKKYIDESEYIFYRIVNFADFSLLPICIILILIVTNRKIKYIQFIEVLVYLMPPVSMAYFIYQGKYLDILFFPCLFYFLSISFYFIRSIKQSPLIKFISLGTISYAVYAIHYPLLLLMNKIPYFTGSIYTFTVRFIFLIAFTCLISYFLERVLQPYIRNRVAKFYF